MGRIAYASNDLETASKHFQKALDAAGSSLGGVAKLGQVRRFRAAARTSLGDVLLKLAARTPQPSAYEHAPLVTKARWSGCSDCQMFLYGFPLNVPGRCCATTKQPTETSQGRPSRRRCRRSGAISAVRFGMIATSIVSRGPSMRDSRMVPIRRRSRAPGVSADTGRPFLSG